MSTTSTSADISPGDILLFSHATGVNRLITLLSRSKFYHVAIYAGHEIVIEARPQGVIRRDLRGTMGTHDGVVIPAPAGAGPAALAWATSQIGDGYDRWDVGVIVLEHLFVHLHLNYAPPGKFSCAEFVARAFQEAGHPIFPGHDPAGMDPGDFGKLVPKDTPIRSFLYDKP